MYKRYDKQQGLEVNLSNHRTAPQWRLRNNHGRVGIVRPSNNCDAVDLDATGSDVGLIEIDES